MIAAYSFEPNSEFRSFHISGLIACRLSCVLEWETAQTARYGPQVSVKWQRLCVRADNQEVGLAAATPSKSA